MRVAGVLLAAGAGRRFGGPKALAGGGAWLRKSVDALARGGCDPVVVVLGAQAAGAMKLLDAPAIAVVAKDWHEGMSASLKAGLHAAAELQPAPDAVLVHLVDLRDVTADVIARLCTKATGTQALARATYHGEPGHPVLLGREHWRSIAEAVTGDAGARDWLRARDDVVPVECSDLAGGRDTDHRPAG